MVALRRHGVEPDVVVTHAGGLPLGNVGRRGAVPGIEVVQADVARPGGLAHDSAKPATVLAALAP